MPERIHPLGRIVQHDPRSRLYSIRAVDPSTLASVRWTRYAPVFDQGTLGSCTGNAMLGALGTGGLFENLVDSGNVPSFDEDEAVHIYSEATAIDDCPGTWPPEDTGSSGLAVAKVAQTHGWIARYTHAFTFEAALTGLAAGPVITGVTWYDTFDIPAPDGECVLTDASQPVGGHEIVVDELDMEARRVWFTNSWGEGWGVGGRAWFSFAVWERLLAAAGDVTAFEPVPPSEPGDDGPMPEGAGCFVAALVGLLKIKGLLTDTARRWYTVRTRG